MNTLIILAALSMDCYTVTGIDQRAYCQALQSQDINYCYSIQNQSLRTQCRSEIQGNSSNCDGIADINERQICRMRAQ